MASSTYRDIIDEKVAEWQKSLKKLEEQAAGAPSETKVEMRRKLDQLRLQIEKAAAQLRTLDEQENVRNTMEIKDKILQIFSSIDRDFPRYDGQTPYML